MSNNSLPPRPMQLSDLIAYAQAAISQYGDLPVAIAIYTGTDHVKKRRTLTLDAVSKCAVTPALTGPDGVSKQNFFAIQNCADFADPNDAVPLGKPAKG